MVYHAEKFKAGVANALRWLEGGFDERIHARWRWPLSTMTRHSDTRLPLPTVTGQIINSLGRRPHRCAFLAQVFAVRSVCGSIRISTIGSSSATAWMLKGKNYEYKIDRIKSLGAGESVGATRPRRDLHGVRRQPAVWMDALRQPHRCEIPLGAKRDSNRVHDFRTHRDLADSR